MKRGVKLTTLKKSAQIVQDMLNEKGFDNEVIELPSSTRTAQEAADALGCKVDQIAKTIVFRLRETNQALLVIASGSNRINENAVGEIVNDALDKADANFVKEETGYAIGGVSPLIENDAVEILIDKDLLQYDDIWAAAGHPKAVFQLTPGDLQNITKGKLVDVS